MLMQTHFRQLNLPSSALPTAPWLSYLNSQARFQKSQCITSVLLLNHKRQEDVSSSAILFTPWFCKVPAGVTWHIQLMDL